MYDFDWIQRTAQWTAQATASQTPPLPDKETTKMDETKSVVPTPLMILKFEWNNVDRYLAYSCIILEATFPYSENLRIPCFYRTPDLAFGL